MLLLEERGHDEFVTRFQQTTRPGDGEGRRGHGLLPLRPPARAERGRRRPGRVRALRRGLPPRERAARRALPAHAAAAARRTTRSAAPTCARGSARSRGMAERWREHVAPLARAERAAPRRRRRPTGPRSSSSTRRSSARGRSSRDRLDGYLEKALREAKRNTSWIDPNERWEAAVKRFARGLYEHEPFLADFEPFAARVAALGDALALGQLAAPADLARACRTSTGRRAAVPRARRPRQPPAGRLGLRRAALALARRAADARDGEAARDPRGARAAQAPARGVRGRLRAARGGRGHGAPFAAATTSSSPFRCAATSPSVDLPRGRWRDVLEGSSRRSAAIVCCCSNGLRARLRDRDAVASDRCGS